MSRPALLVVGGDGPPFSSIGPLLPKYGFVCAADSGYDLARSWGLVPDLIVGDMDSIRDPASLPAGVETLVFPRDKDDTDTELGLTILRKRGYGPIAIAGGGGGRLDHLLAIRAAFERPGGPDEWLTGSDYVVRISEAGEFSARPGAIVSVFPLSGGASGMGSVGLKWPLEGLSWDASRYGVSNEAPTGLFSVTPGSEPLLVVVALSFEPRLLDSRPS